MTKSYEPFGMVFPIVPKITSGTIYVRTPLIPRMMVPMLGPGRSSLITSWLIGTTTARTGEKFNAERAKKFYESGNAPGWYKKAYKRRIIDGKGNRNPKQQEQQ